MERIVFMFKGSFLILFLILVLLFFSVTDVFASASSGGGLPYEDWLTKLRDSVKGPVAFSFIMIGTVVAGCILILGGDLNGFFRSFLLIVLVAGIVIGVDKIMSNFFNEGALISTSLNHCKYFLLG